MSVFGWILALNQGLNQSCKFSLVHAVLSSFKLSFLESGLSEYVIQFQVHNIAAQPSYWIELNGNPNGLHWILNTIMLYAHGEWNSHDWNKVFPSSKKLETTILLQTSYGNAVTWELLHVTILQTLTEHLHRSHSMSRRWTRLARSFTKIIMQRIPSWDKLTR